MSNVVESFEVGAHNTVKISMNNMSKD
jgi:hypothetical protein